MMMHALSFLYMHSVLHAVYVHVDVALLLAPPTSAFCKIVIISMQGTVSIAMNLDDRMYHLWYEHVGHDQ